MTSPAIDPSAARPHLRLALQSSCGAGDRLEAAAAVIPLGGAAPRSVDGGALSAACPRDPGVAVVVVRGHGRLGDQICRDVLGTLADALGEPPPPDRPARRAWLLDGLERAAALLRAAPPQTGFCGASIAVALVVGDAVEVTNLGDVRVVLHRDGRLACISDDQTLRAAAAAAGVPPAEVAALPDVVVRCLGEPDPPGPPPLASLDLAPGDQLLLVSHGVWRALGDDGLLAALRDAPDLEHALARMTAEAARTETPYDLTLALAAPLPHAEPGLALPRFHPRLLDDVAWTFEGPPIAARDEFVAAVRRWHAELAGRRHWIERWRGPRAACHTMAPDSPALHITSWLPDALSRRWPPERVVLRSPRVRIRREHDASITTLTADDGARFTAAELLHKLHAAVTPTLPPDAPRVFLELRLDADGDRASGPLYTLRLAHDIPRLGGAWP